MPKRYRIELTIQDTKSNTQLDASSYEETYVDDADAKKNFRLKDEAQRKVGKGSG